MGRLSIEKIREAVCANRGGLSEATDSQIRIIWDSLTKETQKQYLASIETPEKKERRGKDAIGTRTK